MIELTKEQTEALLQYLETRPINEASHLYGMLIELYQAATKEQ